MDKIQKLFEGIDAKVLTEEVKTAIIEEFNKAVDTKAETKATELFKLQEEEYSKALDEMFETAKKTIELDNQEQFNEAVKTESDRVIAKYSANLQEEAEAILTAEIAKLEEQFTAYIEHAAQTFIEANEAKWVQELEVKKSAKIQEAFVNFAMAFGADLKKLDESDDSQLSEATAKVEALELELKSIKRTKLLDEAVKGLTAPQADNLLKLVEEVEFVDEILFAKKLDMFKSAITAVAPVQEETKKELIDESNLPSWKRKVSK